MSGTRGAYAGLLPEHCQTLLGPRYALLRDEFCGRAIEPKPKDRRVLVNFGGFDAAMQTHQAIRALADFDDLERSEEHTSELQSLMRISSAVFCMIIKSIK